MKEILMIYLVLVNKTTIVFLGVVKFDFRLKKRVISPQEENFFTLFFSHQKQNTPKEKKFSL